MRQPAMARADVPSAKQEAPQKAIALRAIPLIRHAPRGTFPREGGRGARPFNLAGAKRRLLRQDVIL
jgi:hypothetical protein